MTISKPTLIIAEAGVNHNGSLDMAKQLIEVAAGSGADYVKFQTFKSETLTTKTAKKAEYQNKTTDLNQSQFDMIKKLELDLDAHETLSHHCEVKGIKFLSSPFDHDSIDLLVSMNIPLFKVPSGEITNLPYLRYIGSFGKPIIMSSGMSTLKDIEAALQVLENAGADRANITILHCNTEYPTPFSDVNLQAMQTIKNEFKVSVGYSDHTTGIEIPIAAVALGAEVIEKHFTLDHELPGPDHKASITPDELTSMVAAIRNVEISLGSGLKKPSPSEVKNIPVARKSIVAAIPIRSGDIFSESNITTKRPGTGISPMKWDSIIGKKADHDYERDELIYE
jgi:N,N'-diacetyllegionaminate synthase